jgi:hypothetical protein
VVPARITNPRQGGEIGGLEYSQMSKNENFQVEFAETILSEINYAKHVIEVYESLKKIVILEKPIIKTLKI